MWGSEQHFALRDADTQSSRFASVNRHGLPIIELGRDDDKPRNLTKNVTVE
jgi:hypothetical protein